MASLYDLEQTFQHWLHFKTLAPLHFICGTIAANYLETDPVWGMLVGGPGWGKTELLNSTSQLPHVHSAATITEAALLSGTQRKAKAPGAKGGLLREIGDFGFLILKDFTSILSMNGDLRGALLAALREIYDGSWTRHVGVDGGTKLPWSGKLAILAGCTGTIDGHHTVMSTMGERFLLYRFDHTDADEAQQASKAIDLIGREKDMRQDLASAMKHFFEDLTIPKQPTPLNPHEKARLIALATLAARCRSAVERNGHNREIYLVPDHEAPGRLALTLMRLYAGLTIIGVPIDDAWTLCSQVGLDCMPRLRREVMLYLIEHACGHAHNSYGVWGRYRIRFFFTTFTGWSFLGGGGRSGTRDASGRCVLSTDNPLKSIDSRYGWGQEFLTFDFRDGTAFTDLVLGVLSNTHGWGTCGQFACKEPSYFIGYTLP